MKPTVVILHGIGGYAGIHWQQWLHDELTKLGYKVLMPSLPLPQHPERAQWKENIIRLIAQEQSVIFVGHSLAVTSILDVLEEGGGKRQSLISMSGFCSDYGVALNSYFLKEKTIDFAKVKKNMNKSVVFFGDNDPYVPQEKLHELAEQLGVKPIIIPKGGHLNTEAGFTRFPLLLEQIQALS